MESEDIAVLVVGVSLVALFVGAFVLVRRMAARYGLDGAIADTFADADSNFVLEVPAGGPVDIYVHYAMRAMTPSGGGIRYGLVLRLDVERDTADSRFEHRREYLFGDARRPFGEVPLADSLGAGPIQRSGTLVQRGLRLVHVPAGGALTARGRIAMTGGAESESFVVFAKPAAGSATSST